MRKTSLTMFFLTALLCNCTLKSESNHNRSLDGEWDWVFTRGVANGSEYHASPKQMEMNVKYIFDRNQVYIFLNGRENEQYLYFTSGDTLRYGREIVLFSIRGDSLILSNSHCCDDVFTKAFIQKVY